MISQDEIKSLVRKHTEKRTEIKDFMKDRNDLKDSDVIKLNAKIEELDFLISEYKKFIEN